MAAWLRITAMMARSRSLCAVKRLIAGESGDCGRGVEGVNPEVGSKGQGVVSDLRWIGIDMASLLCEYGRPYYEDNH